VERTPTEALDAMKAEGDLPDIDATLKEMHKARGQVGAEYEDIWKATRGQEVPSTKESEAFLKTRVGQAAWKKVQAERADAAQFDDAMKLPTRPARPGSADFESVPDAEAWHRMKQYVNQAAKVGPAQTVLEGVDAADAVFARDKMLPALHAQNTAAAGVDLQYANMSDDMRAFASGANKGRWSKSFDEMTPSQQELYRAGRRAYFGQIVRSGKGRDVIAKQLSDPNTNLAQDAELAFGQGASQRIAQQIATPKQAPFVAPARPAVPPAPAPIPQSPEAAGWLTGRGILDVPTVGDGARPSLGEVRQSLFGMPDTGREALRQGAAGAFRNEMAEGRKLALGNAARQERFSMAATSPENARRMVDTERAWDTALDRQSDILSGRGEVREQPAGGLLAKAAEYFAPTAKWMLAKAGKAQLGEHATITQLKQALGDAEFARLYTGDINKPIRAVQAQRAMSDLRNRAAQRLGAMAGRQGGLLGSQF
jgi:hypothetical protein